MKPQLPIYSIFALFIGLFLILPVMAAPGDLDPSFSQTGRRDEVLGGGGNTFMSKFLIQPDGRILALVQFDYGSPGHYKIVRYNPDSSPDTTFNGNGSLMIQIGAPFYGGEMALQTDGKILVAGRINNTSISSYNSNLAIVRYNPDGSLDTSFGEGGKVTTSIWNSEAISRIVIQSDGKIVAVGTGYNPTLSFFLVRYNPDGSLDTSFDDDGKITMNFSNYFDDVTAAKIQPDGKIIVAGRSYNRGLYVGLVRFNPDGTMDGSFGIEGFVKTTVANNQQQSIYIASDFAIQPDGRIIVSAVSGANSTPIGADFTLLRYNPDGSLDTSFDGDGMVATDFQASEDYSNTVAIQPDGKIIAAGNIWGAFSGVFAMVRYNPDGSIDTSFGSNGKLTGGTLSSGLGSLAIQTDGRIVAAGSSQPGTNYLGMILRCNPDGSPDTSFNSSGQLFIDFGVKPSTAKAVAIQPDGKVVAAGTSYNPGTGNDYTVLRYNPDGSLDQSFNGSGKVTTDVSGPYDLATAVAIQPDGKIIVAGGAQQYPNDFRGGFNLVRYNPDGSLDTSFGSNGKVLTSVLPGYMANDLVVQPDGKIIAAGGLSWQFGRYFTLIRYNPDGSLDTSFDGDGIVSTEITSNTGGSINSVALQPDGKIVAGGYSGDYVCMCFLDFTVVRYNTDGSLDTSFNGNGKAIIDLSNYGNEWINKIAIQADGKIVATGGSPLSGRFTDVYLVRFNPDGSLDLSFNGTGIVKTDISGDEDTARTMAIQPDGKILVAGNSGLYQSAVSGYADFMLARYNTNGSLDTSYGAGGKRIIAHNGSNDVIYGIKIDSAGRAVAAGESDGHFVVARFLGGSIAGPDDFDGDGKADLGIYRAAAGEWWINRSSTGATVAAQFGNSSDRIVPGDFTGDGKTDIAVWRSSTGEWFILRSEDGTFYSIQFGTSGDVPAPRDFDGDGKADLAVFRPAKGIWYINKSSGGYLITPFGTSGDVPVPADYDGDGKSDIAVFRPSDGTWWYLRSSNAQFSVFRFGTSEDKPVPGDYTGDGKTDIAVWRPSTGEWFVQRSEDSSFYSVPFGTAGDIPAPGDYDGDGKFDTAVFRPSGSTWYINRSTSGLLITAFGISTDKPVPSAFVP